MIVVCSRWLTKFGNIVRLKLWALLTTLIRTYILNENSSNIQVQLKSVL